MSTQQSFCNLRRSVHNQSAHNHITLGAHPSRSSITVIPQLIEDKSRHGKYLVLGYVCATEVCAWARRPAGGARVCKPSYLLRQPPTTAATHAPSEQRNTRATPHHAAGSQQQFVAALQAIQIQQNVPVTLL